MFHILVVVIKNYEYSTICSPVLKAKSYASIWQIYLKLHSPNELQWVSTLQQSTVKNYRTENQSSHKNIHTEATIYNTPHVAESSQAQPQQISSNRFLEKKLASSPTVTDLYHHQNRCRN